MERATEGLQLGTALIGSIPRPAWFVENMRRRTFRVAMSDSVYQEQYTDAVTAMIKDQERAGIDILTDGDTRLDVEVAGFSWGRYPGQHLDGVVDQPRSKSTSRAPLGTIEREIDEYGYTNVVVDKVGRGDLQYPEIWKAAQRLTARPMKFGTPSAEVIYNNLTNETPIDDQELVLAIADALNAELTDLADAGCPAIQIEAPWITRAAAGVGGSRWTPDFYAEVFARTVRGLTARTEVWAHLCWGNGAAQHNGVVEDSFLPAVDLLNELECDVITFENAYNGNRHLDTICRSIAPSKKIALGVLNHRSLQVEHPQAIAAALRQALEIVPPERLIATADCGFGREGMSRRIAFYKMVSMGIAANIVRREAGVPERNVVAADPKFSLVADAE